MSANSRERENHKFSTRRILLFAFALLVWLFFLFRALQVFTIGSVHVTMFNSDGAIPVLMANENRPLTLFDTYYYGQDRSGAWPYLIERSLHRVTNHHWSNRELFRLQTIWLFLGVLLLAIMNSRDGVTVGLLCLLPLCLHVTARHNLYELGQPYAWQITALIISWWGLRHLCDYCFGLVKSNREKVMGVAWSGLAFWFALLAVLSSTVSGPILFFLLVLEVWRSIHKTISRDQALESFGKRLLLVALPIASAVMVELLLRGLYHRYSRKHFGYDFRTPIALDRGHLTENLVNQWERFSNSPWWLLSLLPLLVFAAMSARYIYLLKGNKDKLRSSLLNLFLEDRAILVIGTFGIGLINFLITVLITHVRANAYGERYLTLSYIFISFSGLLTLPLLAGRIKKYRRLSSPAIAIASLVFLFLKFPAAVIDPFYQALNQTALNLSQKAPSRVLLGGYWETYVFAALDPQNSIIPVPAEVQMVRTPWTIEALKQSDEVIVEHRSRTLGSAESPAPYLVQYGTPLRLVIPRWYVNGDYAFSVYKNEARQP